MLNIIRPEYSAIKAMTAVRDLINEEWVLSCLIWFLEKRELGREGWNGRCGGGKEEAERTEPEDGWFLRWG
jgi:hypothetical protein